MKHFLCAVALVPLLSFAAPAADSGTGASFKGPVGLQLYSLRGIATQNPPKALSQTKDFGLTLVETAGTYNLPPEKFKALLADEIHRTLWPRLSEGGWKPAMDQSFPLTDAAAAHPSLATADYATAAGGLEGVPIAASSSRLFEAECVGTLEPPPVELLRMKSQRSRMRRLMSRTLPPS